MCHFWRHFSQWRQFFYWTKKFNEWHNYCHEYGNVHAIQVTHRLAVCPKKSKGRLAEGRDIINILYVKKNTFSLLTTQHVIKLENVSMLMYHFMYLQWCCAYQLNGPHHQRHRRVRHIYHVRRNGQEDRCWSQRYIHLLTKYIYIEKSSYKKPGNKERPVIRNRISFPNLYQGNTCSSVYVIKNSGYKEHIFTVPMSSL